MTIYISIFIFLLKNHTRELLKIVSVCLPPPFTNFGTSVCVAVGLLEYSHAKKCNFFKTLRFLFFPCVFGIWTIKQKLPEIQFYLLGLVFNAQIKSWSNVFFQKLFVRLYLVKAKSVMSNVFDTML